MDLLVREIQGDDRCQSLSLGSEIFQPLKRFLRQEAKQLHAHDLAKTFVMVEKHDNKVLGYITTVCSHVSVERFTAASGPEVVGFRYKDYPVVKLARLAVDRKLRGMGAGSHLLDLIIGLILEHVLPHVGCRFLIVDAKSSSVDFYVKKGFSILGQFGTGAEQQTVMFMDLHPLFARARVSHLRPALDL